jgi:pilus assembly protein Flp/PilA
LKNRGFCGIIPPTLADDVWLHIRRLNVVVVFRVFKDEKGQGLTEYAMLLGLIAIAAVAAVGLFGNTIATTFYGAITDAIGDL